MCAHFGECGGCETQDVPYGEQLARKEQDLRELLSAYWQGAIPVEPSPAIWHYRNRVDVNFGRKQYEQPPPAGFARETVLGFKRRGRWYWTLDISECRIGPPGLARLVGAVRDWARLHRLPAFSSRTKDGFLRILLVREGQRTGQRMVALITCDGDMDNASFVEAVQSSFPATSIQRAIHGGWAETTAGELEVLDGMSTIEEVLKIPNGDSTGRPIPRACERTGCNAQASLTPSLSQGEREQERPGSAGCTLLPPLPLGEGRGEGGQKDRRGLVAPPGSFASAQEDTRDLRFRISPFSFFQTNTLATERLYGFVRQWVRETAPAVLYDLYGGSGGIALSCADLVQNVVSVESVAEASADGRHNAGLNAVRNVTFVTQKVEDYLRDLREAQGPLGPDAAVILDPPRAGLHPKAVRQLLQLGPPHVFYVSCKPEVLVKQDLPPLIEQYTLRALQAADLFPHTRHVELLAALRLKE